MNNINMYNSYPEFEGIRLKVDSFIAYKGQDSVMPIFFEEQPITWLLFEKEITDLCHKLSSPNILDVGCGSGFWSILLKKKFPQANVYALDKNKRAIEYTTLNSKDNYTDINIQEIAFEEASYDIKFDIIILTPPYHLFPANRNLKIPFFADGGDIGLTEFYKQLEIAFKLLDENGAILFNQMSVGGNKPSYVDVINKISQGHSDLHYINILEPIETTQFIDSLYPINEYQYNSSDDIIVMSSDINILYYTSGLIKKNSKRFVVSDSNYSEYRSDVKKYCDINKLNYKEPIWEDRIDLHREINSFTPSKRLDILNSNINCYLAKDINNPTEAFCLSGCNMLVDEIKKIIETDSFILDFSTIASIIDSNNNTLTDFITIVNNNDDFWNREENINIQEKLSSSYEHIYKPLKDNNIGVYYHPNFFYSPTSNGIHVSMDPNTFNLDLSNKTSEKNDYNFNEISDNIWFSNVSFPLSYNEFINKTKEPVFSIKKRCHILHGLYCEYYNIKRKSSLLICIPLIGYPFYHNNRYNGLGAMFLYIVTSDIRKYTTKTIQTIANRLSVKGKDITYAYSFNIGKTLADNVTRESIKSAISAIMARNMSHNLGSHFISNTKHYFSNLADNDQDEQRQKDYRGIRHTLQYIQERMDFIATIVSTDSFPYGPVNVKSQIFDELTPDEFGKRHEKATTNFLLDYIVFSEDISKQSSKISKIKLSLELISEGSENFGGNENESETAKHELAKVNLAVPGGVLGRHAIFTIIENIIRNSSKHDKSRIPEDGLKISIKIGDGFIIVFDNKNNAKEKIDGENEILIEHLITRYQGVKILSDGSIDKSNKGLKEILISALWLNNISLADWFSEYESISLDKKIEKLSDVIRIVSVDGHGNESLDGKNLGYYIKLDQYEEIHPINESDVKDGKIEYSIISKIKADIITAKEDYEVVISGNSETNINSEPLRLSHIYPRFYAINNIDIFSKDIMSKIIARNLGISVENLQKTTIHIETPKEGSGSAHNCLWHKDDNFSFAKDDVIFKNHFSNINSLEGVMRVLDGFNNAAYIDSISGGDFTGTLTQPFFLEDELNRLKIIESALTEFAIIDERIYKNYGRGGVCETQNIEADGSHEITEDAVYKVIEILLEQNSDRACIQQSIKEQFNISLAVRKLIPNNEYEIRKEISTAIKEYNDNTRKNNESRTNHNANVHKNKALHQMIKRRRLHIYDINEKGNIIDLDGKPIVNITNDVNEILCTPMFVSIHLSIIEKITKENNGVKASDVMKNLRKLFGGVKFITIHSGRGNLSAELETELKDYAFLSLSAIQAAMDDSKYFLSQLLYNNCYIGKGRINQK